MARVIWAETALRDSESIGEYIELDDPEAAKRVIRRVFKKTDQLEDDPESGSRPRVLKGAPYLRLISKPILIYYRVEGDMVYIVHAVKEERKFDLSRIVENDK